MAYSVQFRRGTTAEHASFAGEAGEVTVNTETNKLVVHDGTTVGGHEVDAAYKLSIAFVNGWTMTPNGANGIEIALGGTKLFSLDNSGNMVVIGNVTAYGTIA